MKWQACVEFDRLTKLRNFVTTAGKLSQQAAHPTGGTHSSFLNNRPVVPIDVAVGTQNYKVYKI